MGVENVILSLLHDIYTHLDKVGYFVRILFINYSSASDIIQPHLLAEKLISLNVGPKLIVWLTDLLVNRSQVVGYHNVLSQVKTTSTGLGEFCRLFCLLYILMILRAVVPCAVCTRTLMTLP